MAWRLWIRGQWLCNCHVCGFRLVCWFLFCYRVNAVLQSLAIIISVIDPDKKINNVIFESFFQTGSNSGDHSRREGKQEL